MAGRKVRESHDPDGQIHGVARSRATRRCRLGATRVQLELSLGWSVTVCAFVLFFLLKPHFTSSLPESILFPCSRPPCAAVRRTHRRHQRFTPRPEFAFDHRVLCPCRVRIRILFLFPFVCLIAVHSPHHDIVQLTDLPPSPLSPFDSSHRPTRPRMHCSPLLHRQISQQNPSLALASRKGQLLTRPCRESIYIAFRVDDLSA